MISRIVVSGVSGSGKSAVGAALAARLGWTFLDADDLHSSAARRQMASGVPLTDAERLPWLGRVGSWLASHPDSVVACSALRASYRARLDGPGTFFVQLTGSPMLLASRLQGRSGHFMPPALLPSQLETLEPLGPAERGVVLSVEPPVEELVDAVLGAIR